MSLKEVAPAFCASRMMGKTFAAYLSVMPRAFATARVWVRVLINARSFCEGGNEVQDIVSADALGILRSVSEPQPRCPGGLCTRGELLFSMVAGGSDC